MIRLVGNIFPFSMWVLHFNHIVSLCDIEAHCFLRDAERLISLEQVEDIELPRKTLTTEKSQPEADCKTPIRIYPLGFEDLRYQRPRESKREVELELRSYIGYRG